jgi:hypothetical protein
VWCLLIRAHHHHHNYNNSLPSPHTRRASELENETIQLKLMFTMQMNIFFHFLPCLVRDENKIRKMFEYLHYSRIEAKAREGGKDVEVVAAECD